MANIERGQRVAIVTGASRGLGRALATGLAQDGWRLVIDGRERDTLAVARQGMSGHVVALAGDITEASHRDALVAAAADLGGVDLLINNAGTLGPSPLPPLGVYPLGGLREVFEINVLAPLALTQVALPALRAAGGSVVLVTSDAAVEPYPGWGGYGSAKAALEQAGRVLAVEEPAVRFWSVDPGDLRTRMHQEAFPGQDISDRPLPESVVPAFRHLLRQRPSSGRVRLSELAVVA